MSETLHGLCVVRGLVVDAFGGALTPLRRPEWRARHSGHLAGVGLIIEPRWPISEGHSDYPKLAPPSDLAGCGRERGRALAKALAGLASPGLSHLAQAEHLHRAKAGLGLGLGLGPATTPSPVFLTVQL